MQPTEPVQLHLPKDIITSMNEAVAAGQYNTPGEIVLAALLQWQLEREAFARRIRTAWQEGMDSPRTPYASIKQMFEGEASES
jgi:Arc/MetJ-type ribon-helix-helix transcriptional regulator